MKFNKRKIDCFIIQRGFYISGFNFVYKDTFPKYTYMWVNNGNLVTYAVAVRPANNKVRLYYTTGKPLKIIEKTNRNSRITDIFFLKNGKKIKNII